MTLLQRSISTVISQAQNGNIYNPSFGICFNLDEVQCDLRIEGDYVIDAYEFVLDHCPSFVGFSGSRPFPINNVKGLGLWEKDNLKSRLALLEHLLNEAIANNL